MAFYTVRDLAERSMRRIMTQEGDAAVEADELMDYLYSLNDFMSALETNGVRLGYTRASNPTDEVTVPDGAIQGIIANMAIEVAADFGGEVSPTLIRSANTGMAAMRKLGRAKTQSRYPSDMPQGSGNYDSAYLSNQFYRNNGGAVLTLSGNAHETTISAANTKYRVMGFWSQSVSKGFRCDITGTITNINRAAVKTTAKVTLSATGSGSYTFHLMKNGVSFKSSAVTLSATSLEVSLTSSVELEHDDYVEVWVESTGTNNPTITDGRLSVT